MNKKEESKSTSHDVKIIHVKIIDGTEADVYEIGQAMKEFKKKLPFKLEAIVTNDRVELRDVDHLLRELYKLKKQIEQEKLLGS